MRDAALFDRMGTGANAPKDVLGLTGWPRSVTSHAMTSNGYLVGTPEDSDLVKNLRLRSRKSSKVYQGRQKLSTQSLSLNVVFRVFTKPSKSSSLHPPTALLSTC
jgi:hypothetical protein